MKYKDIPPILRAWLGCREALRKLGFKPEELFLLVSDSARTGVEDAMLLLRAQGREFTVDCGPIKMQREEFSRQYNSVVEAVNGGKVPDADLDRIWQECEFCQNKLGLVRALTAKGFDLERACCEGASCMNYVGNA